MSETDLIVIGVASALAMLIKSIMGLGYPLLAIPVIALATGVEDAVVVITLPNAVANLLIGLRVRHRWSQTRDMDRLIGTALMGAVLGTFVLVSAPEAPLLAVLALAIVGFVVRSLWWGDLTVRPALGRRISPVIGLVAGVAQGAVGVSGPILASWLYSYRLNRDAYILSLSVFFLLVGAAQIAALAALGEYTGERLVASAVAFAPAVVLPPVGERLRGRLSGAQFDRAVLVLLVLAAATLTVRALSG